VSASRPGSTLVVGASLAADVEVLAIQPGGAQAGVAETGPALSLLRDLLATGRVVHDDVSPELDDQALACRVDERRRGVLGLVAGPGRTCCVPRCGRCVSCARSSRRSTRAGYDPARPLAWTGRRCATNIWLR
jgi:hypothetical protein